jgi:MFS family permease
MRPAQPGIPGGSSPWLVAVTVGFAAFMEVLDISIANVALQHIAGSLAASADESTWVLTSYWLPMPSFCRSAVGSLRRSGASVISSVALSVSASPRCSAVPRRALRC